MKTELTDKVVNRLYKYRANIDLEPQFQRQKVWSTKKQQYFIDTILKGWGVPKMYFLVLSKKGSATNLYACVDGKQRLTAIYNFLGDELSLNTEYSGIHGGKKYSELTEKTQDQFDEYQIDIEEVSEATNDEISELFKRLQGGTPLNSGEKLMAVGGDLCKKIKTFSTHKFLKEKILLSDTRYTYFTICAQLTYLENHGISNLSFTRLENFLKQNKSTATAGFELKSNLKKIKEVLDTLKTIFDVAPTYFKNRASVVSTYLLISELIDKGSIDDKHHQIKAFFDKFMKDLEEEVEKGSQAKDAQLISYQSAVTQGADKQKSIKTRHEILVDRLIKFDPSFHTFFNKNKEPILLFNELYEKFGIKLGNGAEIDKWIFTQKPHLKSFTCGRSKNKESLPTHIRHCIHHKRHGTYTIPELRKAIKLLDELKTKLPK
ncbi:MAG: hypothetical protein COA96_14980 [SAR86 cluster bacterium]|uniref:GmrSD restriction endonucleases N-terminal domain-containing protein n=1 Tax=SAR86 cluster bacterium TaxID=2030880 RepID=A0A2A5ARX7_9GAMM|nr:MAG: hypothetical protein COA96_14980 [SAR86 cluster bacterium]